MLANFPQVKNSLIWSQGEKIPTAKLLDIVVSPLSGQLAAFWASSVKGLVICSWDSLLVWDRNGLIIDRESSLQPAKEASRLHAVLNQEVPILKTPVFQKKQKIGLVQSFVFQTNVPQMLSINVRQFRWWGARYLITFQQINRITKQGIFINDDRPLVPTDEGSKRKLSSELD